MNVTLQQILMVQAVKLQEQTFKNRLLMCFDYSESECFLEKQWLIFQFSSVNSPIIPENYDNSMSHCCGSWYESDGLKSKPL